MVESFAILLQGFGGVRAGEKLTFGGRPARGDETETGSKNTRVASYRQTQSMGESSEAGREERTATQSR